MPNIQKGKSVQAMLLLCCSWSGCSFAADFYTIIGPDGRPMIIQQKTASVKSNQEKAKQEKVKQEKAFIQTPKLEPKPSEKNASDQSKQYEDTQLTQNKTQPAQNTHVQIQPIRQNSKDPSTREQALEQKKTPNSSTSTQQIAEKRPLIRPVQNIQQSADNEINNKATPSTSVTHSKETTIQSRQNMSDKGIATTEIQEAKEIKPSTSVSEPNSISKPTIASTHQKSKAEDSKFTEIDGVQYVDNEYLEDKEFNLEGKKRFYIMSESGVAGGRQFETVEREKGISKSVFSKFLKRNEAVHVPIVLSSTYFRLPKEQVVENLQQACFTGKKIDKAKFLSTDKDEVGFWPVAPIKENFAYEVVKLDHNVENIQLSSYASSQKSPSYYWPLVVFLDQQGCVIEGVTGFKNEDVDANHRQFASLVGVLKKPNHAHFLFMTPLAESVDVDNLKLSNTGQIKLNVLR